MKKVFITFSKTAYTANPRFYAPIVEVLMRIPDTILEHRWFEPKNVQSPAENEGASLHQRSLSAIAECDIFIAEISKNSTSVGLQISSALQKKKLTLLCMQEKFKHKKVFSFLKGTRATYLHFVYYKNLEDFEEQIENLIQNYSNTDKLMKFNFVTSERIKKILLQESKKRDLSASELLRNIIEDWINKR